MEQTLKFCIDHFSVATPKRMEAAAVMQRLGFVTGDTSVDRSTHFIFENTLSEICYRKEGEPAVWQGNSIEVGKMPRIHSLRLSNKGLDPNTARDALLQAGIPGVGPVNEPSSQRVKYGAVQGDWPVSDLFHHRTGALYRCALWRDDSTDQGAHCEQSHQVPPCQWRQAGV